jgi:hypothetical protein
MGISDTSAAISSDVGSHVKAMIWMGDPRHTPGAPYNVGTSTASGVGLSANIADGDTDGCSLTLGLEICLAVRIPISFSHTVTRQIRIARTAMMGLCIRVMGRPMARMRWNLSMACWLSLVGLVSEGNK